MDGAAVSASLLLRFAGPIQAWSSTPDRYRHTNRVPTRSGIEGLLAAALGLPRGHRPDWFGDLDFAVRVIRPGELLVDYHTISPIADVERSEGLTRPVTPGERAAAGRLRFARVDRAGRAAAKGTVTAAVAASTAPTAGHLSTILTEREYLADAEFLVAVGHPDPDRVRELRDAVRAPQFLLWLGRKNCAPAAPLLLGSSDHAPLDAVQAPNRWHRDPTGPIIAPVDV